MDLEYGKFQKHCTDCPGLGTCIGDYRNVHCHMCDRHFFHSDPCQDCYRFQELERDVKRGNRVALAHLYFYDYCRQPEPEETTEDP
eukprot:Awhi_evm1s5116